MRKRKDIILVEISKLLRNVKLQTFFILVLVSVSAESARIKDIAIIEGSGGVQVIGYGLVTGLNNTGDNQLTTFTVQSVSNMLKRFGLTIPATNPRIRNVAAVMVTATAQSFMRAGSKVDVTVSSIGDATSLQGGVLLMAPLSTADGNIVGMAQGAVSVGGFDFQALGSRVGRNFVTSGRVPNGLILDTELAGQVVDNNQIRVLLRDPDFTTASRIAGAINASPGLAGSATPLNAATVSVQLPAGAQPGQITQLIAQIEALNVQSDPVARVVINERTGTIVVGRNVQLLPAVVAHGGLEISIQKRVTVPQLPAYPYQYPHSYPYAYGYPGFGYPGSNQWNRVTYEFKPIENADLSAEEENNAAVALEVLGPTVQDMANALNLLNVRPRDLIAIFQALKESGSLQGELIIQ